MKKSTNSIKVTGIAQYVSNKAMRNDTKHRIKDGNWEWFYKGEWILEEKFYALFDLTLKKVNYKGENPDKTKF